MVPVIVLAGAAAARVKSVTSMLRQLLEPLIWIVPDRRVLAPSRIVIRVSSTAAILDRLRSHAGGEVGRRDSQAAEVDPVLVVARAAAASKLLIVSLPKPAAL